MSSEPLADIQARWYELEQLFEHSPVGLALLDRDLRYLRSNPALCRISGIPVEQRIGRSLTDLYPEHAATMVPAMRQVIETRRAIHGIETRMATAGGERVIIASYLPVCEPDGTCDKVCVVAFDATELRRAETAAAAARDQAEAASRAKDQFIAALSHELRTPLTPVLASVTHLQRRGDLPADVREELAMIRRNVALEARLIDDLLDVTRVTQGKVSITREPTDLHAVITDALQICRSEAVAKGLRMDVRLQARRATVLGDPARLQQICWNVISNAVKFTPGDGLVTVRTNDGPGGRIVVEVVDTGIGISPALLPRIFAPFEQGDSRITSQFGGLGLGLTICKALVDLHGGSIAVSSPGLGQGARVTFDLPLHHADAVPPTPALPGEPVLTASLQVLLVDDHPDTLKVMARLLASFGYQVATAVSVADAAERSAAGRFDLLISDLGLPDGNGMDVLSAFRRHHAAPAIALSGYGMEEDVRASLTAGFSRHLTKPIDLAELRRAIEGVVGR